MTHDCVRLNRQGQILRELVEEEEIERWTATHQRMRPSWALMVDGRVVHPGSFVAAEVHVFETQYLIDNGRSLISLPPPPLHLNYAK